MLLLLYYHYITIKLILWLAVNEEYKTKWVLVKINLEFKFLETSPRIFY